MSYLGTSSYPHQRRDLTAVLVVNLGTPDAPTTTAVRRYLAEFLWDPRVIESPRWLWWLVLHGVILRLRPRRSAHAYQSVWTAAGSPLLTGTRALVDELGAKLDPGRVRPLAVRMAMRYGNPSIASVLRELQAQGLRRLLVLPLYPQYSGSTTASVFDAVAAELSTWRHVPELRLITEYFADGDYLDALAESIRAHRAQHGAAQKLLFSFHGIPRRYFRNGDPYFCHCQATVRGVVERLGLAADDWQLSFQSRVGREEWLRPYTDETLAAWPKQGVRSVQVVCPGFAIDCLETLEEIAMLNRDAFLAAGGERYEYIPALNASAPHVAALSRVVRRHAQDWSALGESWSAATDEDALAARQARHLKVQAENPQ